MLKSSLKTLGNVPILEALKAMDASGTGALFVVDAANKLIGIVTDGDVRRGLLKNIPLSAPIADIMSRKFYSWPFEKSREQAVLHLKQIQRRQMPIVDKDGILVDVLLLDEIEFKRYQNPVIFMAGGLGKRLHPLTQDVPKPMLTVGGKPILESMLTRFASQGFDQFFMCTNYKSEYIEDHFRNGEKWNVSVKFVREEKQLGTAGALGLLKSEIKLPCIVMNGDILTSVDLTKLLEYHEKNPAAATVCVAQYGIEVPYGVVETKNKRVVRITEKPTKQFHINSGIYLLDPQVLEYVPHNEYLDMPTLLDRLITAGQIVNSFPIHEYWTDIGNIRDYEKANADFDPKNQ